MVLTKSSMLELGAEMPRFSLPNMNRNAGDKMVSDQSLRDSPAILVAFICNHCPYVVHIKRAFSMFAEEYAGKGMAVVAINSNDRLAYPADSPDKMSRDAKRFGYRFPYLHDESQLTASEFHATCTPDFYLYDSRGRLAYRGQFDSSRPNNGIEVTGADLRAAADAVLTGGRVSVDQRPSVGCSIKWKLGMNPDG